MNNTKKKSKIAKVDPLFIKVADDFRFDIKKKHDIDIPRTQASRIMADTFDKMMKANGTPMVNGRGKKKKKTLFCTWEFKI